MLNATLKTIIPKKMISAVNFLFESGISLAAFSLIYIFLLRKETFFKLNRIFLLGSIIFSIILPFLKLRIYEANPVMLTEITILPYRNLIEAVTVYGKDLSGTIEKAILSADFIIVIYLSGVALFLVRFLIRIGRLLYLIVQNPPKHVNGFSLVTLDKEFSPYSFLNYVFVSQSMQKDDNYNKMIIHEMEHVKQGHSFDVIILEILNIFQWFNPFLWLMGRAIRENHEFLADQAVLNTGINIGQYKKLLLTQYIGCQFEMANSFNYSLIKSRIKMMSRKSSKLANSKLFIGIFVAVVLVMFFACEQKESFDMATILREEPMRVTVQNEKLKLEGAVESIDKIKNLFANNTGFEISYDDLGNIILSKKEEVAAKLNNEEEQIFMIAENMPEFPGGEESLRKFITNSVVYPEIAINNGIQGKVYVTFVVTKNGSIANAKIARGVDPALDKEALRVVNSLPKWKPGKQRGQDVNVSYTVPINFMIDSDNL
jgi:TonB family protein